MVKTLRGSLNPGNCAPLPAVMSDGSHYLSSGPSIFVKGLHETADLKLNWDNCGRQTRLTWHTGCAWNCHGPCFTVSLAAQVRQHVPHKRTFFYLEQLILKFNADAHCLSMKEIHEVLSISPSACHRSSMHRRHHQTLLSHLRMVIAGNFVKDICHCPYQILHIVQNNCFSSSSRAAFCIAEQHSCW